MNLVDYQKHANTFANYDSDMYPIMGLAEEVGEVMTYFSKMARGDYPTLTDEKLKGLRGEIGDLLWFVAELASQQGWNLEAIAEENIRKLTDRKIRNVIRGEGDER